MSKNLGLILLSILKHENISTLIWIVFGMDVRLYTFYYKNKLLQEVEKNDVFIYKA